MEQKHASEQRYALLIDADNVSAKYLKPIMDELSKYGTVTVKRIYGDWTLNLHAKWKDALLENSITPIQQFGYTQGKNATDSAMIIDAMDILYTGSVDGFCIVSSDSDFTRLASRLRESGRTVIGMGEKKTPTPFRKACDIFTTLELLVGERDGKSRSKNGAAGAGAGSGQTMSKSEIERAVVDIITENLNNGKSTGLGEVGSRLLKRYPDFDVRSYGTKLLSKLLDEFTRVKITRDRSSVTVELVDDKDRDTAAEAAPSATDASKASSESAESGAASATDAADAARVPDAPNGADGAADAGSDATDASEPSGDNAASAAEAASDTAPKAKRSGSRRRRSRRSNSRVVKQDAEPAAVTDAEPDAATLSDTGANAAGAGDAEPNAANPSTVEPSTVEPSSAEPSDVEQAAEQSGSEPNAAEPAAESGDIGQTAAPNAAETANDAPIDSPQQRTSGAKPTRRSSARRSKCAAKPATSPATENAAPTAPTPESATAASPAADSAPAPADASAHAASAAPADTAAVEAYIRQLIRDAGREGIALSALSRRVRGKFRTFKVRDLGFTQLKSYVASLDDIEIEQTGSGISARMGE